MLTWKILKTLYLTAENVTSFPESNFMFEDKPAFNQGNFAQPFKSIGAYTLAMLWSL